MAERFTICATCHSRCDGGYSDPHPPVPIEVVPLSSLTALADEWEKRADSYKIHQDRSALRSCAGDLRKLLDSTPGNPRNNPTGGDDG